MVIEALTIDLGAAVAKTVLKIWLGDPDVAASTSADIGEIVASKISSLLQQRRAGRAFDRIAEEVAEVLDARLSVEYGGLASNEKNAAILAVRDTLSQTPLTSDVLFGADLDPLRLEELYRSGKPDAAQRALLVPAAIQFYDRLLQEVCEYVVAITIGLPQFGDRATVEMLQRETELLELVKKVLESLPRQAAAFSPDTDEFETRYRRAIVRKLDRLELFGITVSEFSRRYRLNVAYITLTATATASARRHMRRAPPEPPPPAVTPISTAGRDKRDSVEGGDQVYVRVDTILADSPRVLVRGEAGSGKTTLLQYLAVRAGAQSFEPPLETLNNYVPFFIQLRRYAREQLPKPEQFIDLVAPQLTGLMRAGWVHAQLESGRALLLIDGVDELPQRRRRDVREWIRDLRETFPKARYVVTSRPPAVSEDWLSDEEFESSELQPMAPPDVAAFVDHWHEAAAADLTDDDELKELDRLKQRLQAAVREIPPIRALATSPLLCAMLCALNRDRKSQLPKDRLELYRISLETLLDRRDIEREVEANGTADLAYPAKKLLLQDLSYWLLRNGWTDVDKDGAINRFRVKLTSMPHAPSSGTQVFDYLLERSGLLREPVAGRVDFVHRTFQEYLAAKQAIDEDDIGVLLEHATEDAWREVIVLAAGHARLKQRVRLISGLLKRGRDTPERKHLLHLLAVACLETSPELPADLTAELTGCLQELVPPRNMTEARALASAGELAVPLLRDFRRKNVPIATACIRTLALIGGDAAQDLLARFAADTRVMVSRELIRAWRAFDPARYAEIVLGNAEFPRGLTVEDIEQLKAVRHLRRLDLLTVDGTRMPQRAGAVDLEWLSARHDTLVVLALQNVRRIVNFDALASLTRLKALQVMNCGEVEDLAPIRELGDLEWLMIWDTPSISKLDALHGLRLEECYLRALRQSSEYGVLANPSLRVLHATRCGASDLRGFDRATALENLNLDRTEILGNLDELGALSLNPPRNGAVLSGQGV